jgi:hypothetical protein
MPKPGTPRMELFNKLRSRRKAQGDMYEAHEQRKKSFEDFRKETGHSLPYQTFEENLQLSVL